MQPGTRISLGINKVLCYLILSYLNELVSSSVGGPACQVWRVGGGAAGGAQRHGADVLVAAPRSPRQQRSRDPLLSGQTDTLTSLKCS